MSKVNPYSTGRPVPLARARSGPALNPEDCAEALPVEPPPPAGRGSRSAADRKKTRKAQAAARKKNR